MNRTAELGELITTKLELASVALKQAESDLAEGVSTARTEIRSARAVMRLLEPAGAQIRVFNDSLGIAASRLGPIRDGYVKRNVPPPLSPSILSEIHLAATELEAARAEMPELLESLSVPNDEIIGAAGRTYRQARRRFLRALPLEEDDPFDVESLNKCRKATQRVHLQAEALLGPDQSKRSKRFGQLGELIWQHRDGRVLGTQDAAAMARLEAEITKLGLLLFKRKPSAHRDWLAEKLDAQ